MLPSMSSRWVHGLGFAEPIWHFPKKGYPLSYPKMEFKSLQGTPPPHKRVPVLSETPIEEHQPKSKNPACPDSPGASRVAGGDPTTSHGGGGERPITGPEGRGDAWEQDVAVRTRSTDNGQQIHVGVYIMYVVCVCILRIHIYIYTYTHTDTPFLAGRPVLRPKATPPQPVSQPPSSKPFQTRRSLRSQWVDLGNGESE